MVRTRESPGRLLPGIEVLGPRESLEQSYYRRRSETSPNRGFVLSTPAQKPLKALGGIARQAPWYTRYPNSRLGRENLYDTERRP